MRIYMQKPSVEQKPPRYYQLVIQQDLINGWNLLMESGEQGRAGRVKKHHFDEWSDAMDKMMLIRDSQLQRGYKVMFVQGQGLPDMELAGK